jgi:hypothetical protein
LFKRLANYPDAPPDLASLGQADVACFLIDGAGLANRKERHATLHDARMLLRAIFEKHLIAPATRAQVVVTKWDLLSQLPEESTERLTAEVRKAVLSDLPSTHQVELFITAARPRPREVPWAYGCATLLTSWLAEPPTQGTPSPDPAPASDRQFDKYLHTFTQTAAK